MSRTPNTAARSSAPFRIWPGMDWQTLVIACCTGGFVALATAVSVDRQPYFAWDLRVTQALQARSGRAVESLMRGVSIAGDDVLTSGVLVMSAAFFVLAAFGRREAAILILAVAAGQFFKITAKHLIGRPRPQADLVRVLIDAKEVQSFPSGHAVHYVVFFGFLGFLALTLPERGVLRWPVAAGCGALVALIGPARIYLGAHWASDVVAGYLMGSALLLASERLYRLWVGGAQGGMKATTDTRC